MIHDWVSFKQNRVQRDRKNQPTTSKGIGYHHDVSVQLTDTARTVASGLDFGARHQLGASVRADCSSERKETAEYLRSSLGTRCPATSFSPPEPGNVAGRGGSLTVDRLRSPACFFF